MHKIDYAQENRGYTTNYDHSLVDCSLHSNFVPELEVAAKLGSVRQKLKSTDFAHLGKHLPLTESKKEHQ